MVGRRPIPPGYRAPRPTRIDGANWQAGVTRDSEKLQPFIHGANGPQPVRDAIAASELEGWVVCRRRGADGEYARDGLDRPITYTVYGRVELRPAEDEA